ncbi:hypothetical protein O1L68_43320 [Streptomyces lydicus]|nr:hypothetical protein [Streptomyces lydicus]
MIVRHRWTSQRRDRGLIDHLSGQNVELRGHARNAPRFDAKLDVDFTQLRDQDLTAAGLGQAA